jgi:hypothetical protein
VNGLVLHLHSVCRFECSDPLDKKVPCMMSHATRERPVDYISKVWSIIFWGFAWFYPPLISECILEAPFLFVTTNLPIHGH